MTFPTLAQCTAAMKQVTRTMSSFNVVLRDNETMRFFVEHGLVIS